MTSSVTVPPETAHTRVGAAVVNSSSPSSPRITSTESPRAANTPAITGAIRGSAQPTAPDFGWAGLVSGPRKLNAVGTPISRRVAPACRKPGWNAAAKQKPMPASSTHRATPAAIYQTLPKALPAGSRDPDSHDRIRHDRIDDSGSVTLRHNGKLHHIGVGRTHARTHVILLVADLGIRVVNALTGELLRDLILDPNRDYQPTGAPKGPTRRRRK